MDWLAEIVRRLEEDPDECWPAIEGLSAVDEEVRVQVIEELAGYRDRPAVRSLLALLGAASRVGSSTGLAIRGERREPAGRVPQIDRSLVTAIDGDGRGTIALSTVDRGFRRTAAFRCDVRRGLLDAIGEVEEEHPEACRLIDEWIQEADDGCAIDVPELAVRLLEGCSLLSDPRVPEGVRAWLDATIGPRTSPTGLAATLPGPEPEAIPDRELAQHAGRILDACPDWLDRSTLTFEMAREIALREGLGTPDPIRDAGAYRYLFEHLLLGRLELYARMLLWMGWIWHANGRHDLSRPAFTLAAQLSDDQYAVPSHPFTVALTTRSLLAAQAAIRGEGPSNLDPRRPDRL